MGKTIGDIFRFGDFKGKGGIKAMLDNQSDDQAMSEEPEAKLSRYRILRRLFGTRGTTDEEFEELRALENEIHAALATSSSREPEAQLVDGYNVRFWHQSYHMLREAITTHLDRFIIDDNVPEEAILCEAIERAGVSPVEGEPVAIHQWRLRKDPRSWFDGMCGLEDDDDIEHRTVFTHPAVDREPTKQGSLLDLEWPDQVDPPELEGEGAREALDRRIVELIQDDLNAHSSPESPFYNDCKPDDLCSWCDEAKEVIAALASQAPTQGKTNGSD